MLYTEFKANKVFHACIGIRSWRTKSMISGRSLIFYKVHEILRFIRLALLISRFILLALLISRFILLSLLISRFIRLALPISRFIRLE